MAQTKRRSISHVCGLRSAAEKEGACYMDDFTINFAITFVVLLIGLALLEAMMRSERAFGGTKVYGITVDCPCKGCDLRGCGCASICDAYKKYKFILAILKKNRQAKVRAASECRMMRDERIAEWRRNRCWPKG